MFWWLNVALQLAAAIWLTFLVRRIDFAAEEKAACDKIRASWTGRSWDGYCTDCSPGSCWC